MTQAAVKEGFPRRDFNCFNVRNSWEDQNISLVRRSWMRVAVTDGVKCSELKSMLVEGVNCEGQVHVGDLQTLKGM